MPDPPAAGARPYRDFDLLVERSGKGYRARALDSPAGQAGVKLPRSLPAAMERLAAALERASRGEEPAQPVRALAMELGAELYRGVFSGDLGKRFETCLNAAADREILRLRLRLSEVPELSRWPWELLFHPEEHRFLALSAETPIVRFPEMAQSLRPLRAAPPLTILAVIADGRERSPLAGESEWTRIEKALSPLIESGRLRLERLEAPTLLALQARLAREPVHVLHFIGHGASGAPHGEGALLFSDPAGRPAAVAGERLGSLLRDHSSLRLAVLNACEGARHDETDAFTGVAQRLLQQRIPAVVAMQRAITNRAAVTFAQGFYASLAAGRPIETAVWVADRYVEPEGEDPIDPRGPRFGEKYVARGSSFYRGNCGVASRAGLNRKSRHMDVGFRIAATPLH